ncbi:MAG: ankyrin repeat domain-containing protein [Proteobacteria bacterium]|nr:ankyrin repeat domain-containing protein [Pseudomonadota bacterium]NBP14889.1 ankyrin repeat domain-containing protein [bacterium]
MKNLLYILILLSLPSFVHPADAANDEPPAELANIEDPRGPKLVAAVRAKDFETMKNLLDQGVPILTRSAKGSSLLTLAAEAGDIDIFNYLIENGLAEDVNHKNSQGITPLMLAAHNGHPDIVRLLLKRGALVNERSKSEGFSALYLSIQNRHTPDVQYAVVKLLLEYGAAVDTIDNHKKTPLILASQYSKFNKTTRLLLEHGVTVNLQDDNGLTALMTAASVGNYEIVKLLLNLDPDPGTINLQQNNGATALYKAARNGHAHVVQLLLERGADMHKHLTGNDLYTPLNVAAFSGHLPVIRVIEEFERQNGRSIIDFHGFAQAVQDALDEGKNNVVAYLANKVKEAGFPVPERFQRVIDQEDQGIVFGSR